MKTSNFLLFLAIYGILTGCMMLFNSGSSLINYGVKPIDHYHISIIQYVGISNITMGLLSFLLRNEHSKVTQAILLTTSITTVGSFLKGCYDVYIVNLPSNTFFWIDMSFRFLVGLISLYFVFKTKEN
ncbi:hypothetical protein [Emticicia sp. SJ17W-69]|uniref:hypothetical protein n=1 Tax=Emticicia sp. SJ17W-69 TaxID=3421657 RepID=UPI003EB9B75A